MRFFIIFTCLVFICGCGLWGPSEVISEKNTPPEKHLEKAKIILGENINEKSKIYSFCIDWTGIDSSYKIIIEVPFSTAISILKEKDIYQYASISENSFKLFHHDKINELRWNCTYINGILEYEHEDY